MHDDDTEDKQPEPPEPDPDPDADPNTDENLIEILDSEPRSLLRRRAQPDFGARDRSTVFTVQNLDNFQMTFRVSGLRSYQGGPVKGWRVDFGSLNVQMNDLGRFIAAYHAQEDDTGREAWRHTAEEIGMHLYNGLLNTDPVLAQHLMAAFRRAIPPENLTLVFEGSRDYLSVPYELLHDGRTPLALRYPICRRMVNVSPGQPFSALIQKLKESDAPLKVLLITSGARQVAADQEIEILETSFPEHTRRAGLTVDLEIVWAGLDTIKQKLAVCPYHIVHYAGQVYHDKLHPDNGGLLFTAGRNSQIGQMVLTMRELADLLHGGATQLFFASACVGPQVWDEYVLHEDNHLDLLDSLAQTGVPYALGFRWYATNEGRQRFAQHFYQSLFAAPFAPELAALRARQALQRWDGQDETWASPILIASPVHG